MPHAQISHLWPLGLCLPQWPMGRRYLRVCRRGALQYVVVRLCTSAVACAWELTSYAVNSHLAFPMPRYQEGEYKSAYPYLSLINACSQGWAIYCLVMFFRAVRTELAPIRPLLKFGIIKAVVFLTFWQSLGIELLMPWLWSHWASGADDPARSTQHSSAATLKATLICFEMLVASLVHPFAFPASDYSPSSTARYAPQATLRSTIGDLLSSEAALTPTLGSTLYEALVPTDVVSDMQACSWGLFSPRRLGLADFANGKRSLPSQLGGGSHRSPVPSETTTMSQQGSMPPSPSIAHSPVAGSCDELASPAGFDMERQDGHDVSNGVVSRSAAEGEPWWSFLLLSRRKGRTQASGNDKGRAREPPQWTTNEVEETPYSRLRGD